MPPQVRALDMGVPVRFRRAATAFFNHRSRDPRQGPEMGDGFPVMRLVWSINYLHMEGVMGWRYEGLFETEITPEADDLSRYWRPQPSEIPVGRMGYRRSVVLAGDRLECEIYPVFGRDEAQKARAARKNITPEKQKKLNNKRALRHLIQLADANFTDRDIHLTLTYRHETTLPACRKDVRNFLLRVKRYREKHGMEPLKYIYTIEGRTDLSKGFPVNRIHVHMLMNGGISRELLEELWELGYANADRLQPTERGLEEIATYIIKEARDRKQGSRKWSASRNLKQPQKRTTDAKTSNRAVKLIAHDFQHTAKAEMEKLYPRYSFVDCKVYYSDQLDGVYIRILMWRRRK